MSFIIGMSDDERIACDRLQMAAEKRAKFVAASTELAQRILTDHAGMRAPEEGVCDCWFCEQSKRVLEHQPKVAK